MHPLLRSVIPLVPLTVAAGMLAPPDCWGDNCPLNEITVDGVPCVPGDQAVDSCWVWGTFLGQFLPMVRASYDAQAGILAISGLYQCGPPPTWVAIHDVYTVSNLTTGMPLTFRASAPGVDFIGSDHGTVTGSYEVTIHALAGEPFTVDFGAYATTGGCGQICDETTYCDISGGGQLQFLDLPPGAVVTSCEGFGPAITGVEDASAAPTSMAIHRLSPNPTSGPFDATITLPGSAPALLELFDVRGRLVRRVTLEARAGEQRVRIATTSRLASGIYLLRLTQGSRAVWAKEAVVR